MNADERRSLDDLTERVLGAIFEVADILVEDVLVLELKCVDRLSNDHMAQCLNYLRASGMSLCLLVNFQKPTVEWKRVVLKF